MKGKKRRKATILHATMEKELVEYLFKMQEISHGLNSIKLKVKVAEMMEGMENPFTSGILDN